MTRSILFAASTRKPAGNKVGILESAFQQELGGKSVSLWTLRNAKGLEVSVTNYGAKIVSILVPDQDGNWVDVVTGYNNLDDYLKSGEPYFGAAIGRYGNRIANGQFKLDGKSYQLAQNNGPNNLHGGPNGFHNVVWDAIQIDESTLELSYFSKDGEEGFPGNLQVRMTYHINNKNEFQIEYYATTDRTTICNLTNHTYFNLSGEGADTILDHVLELHADAYIPTNDVAIPLGNIAPVEGTPMDFRTATPIGLRIQDKFQDLVFGNGYDHTYVINKGSEKLAFTASVYSPLTGIRMDVLTDQPGVQLYTGNYMNGTEIGKSGKAYLHRAGFCLETQCFPDSPNQPQFPSVVLKSGELYRHTVVHRFGLTK
ncbi:MAG: aldose epimerase family protein [Prolixibacteraceae bacterium]